MKQGCRADTGRSASSGRAGAHGRVVLPRTAVLAALALVAVPRFALAWRAEPAGAEEEANEGAALASSTPRPTVPLEPDVPESPERACSPMGSLGQPEGFSTGDLPAAPLSEPQVSRRLRLMFYDVNHAAPRAYESMTSEVQRIFSDLEVAVSWQRAALGDATSPDQIQVILLNTSGPDRGSSRRVLGATRRGGGRAVWAFLPNVAFTLGVAPEAEAWSMREREEMGRALGRVIAHELVHVVWPERPHAESGLMRQELNRGILVGLGVRFDPETTRGFPRALLVEHRPPASVAGDRGTLTFDTAN
jgi:hypothetical protein